MKNPKSQMKLDWYKKLKEKLEKDYIETDLEFDLQLLEKILIDVEDRLPEELKGRNRISTAIYLYSEDLLDKKLLKSLLYKTALLNSREIQYTAVRDSIEKMTEYISNLTSFEKDFVRNEVEKFISIPDSVEDTIDKRVMVYIKDYMKSSDESWSIPFLYYHSFEVENRLDERVETIERKLEEFFQKRFSRGFDSSLFFSINREIFRGTIDLDSLSKFKKFYEEDFDNSEIALLLDIQSKAFVEESLRYIELDEDIRDQINRINYSFIERDESSILEILSEVRDSQLLELLYNVEDRYIYDIKRESNLDIYIEDSKSGIEVEENSNVVYSQKEEERRENLEEDETIQRENIYVDYEDRKSTVLFTLLPNIKNSRNRADLLRLKHLLSKYDINTDSMSIEEILEKSEELYMRYENGERNSDYLKIYYSITSLLSPELAKLTDNAEEVTAIADLDSNIDGVIGFNLIKNMINRFNQFKENLDFSKSIFRNFREQDRAVLHNLVEQQGVLLYDRLTESFLVVDKNFSDRVGLDSNNSYIKMLNLIYAVDSRQFEREIIELSLKSLHSFENSSDSLLDRSSNMFTIPDLQQSSSESIVEVVDTVDKLDREDGATIFRENIESESDGSKYRVLSIVNSLQDVINRLDSLKESSSDSTVDRIESSIESINRYIEQLDLLVDSYNIDVDTDRDFIKDRLEGFSDIEDSLLRLKEAVEVENPEKSKLLDDITDSIKNIHTTVEEYLERNSRRNDSFYIDRREVNSLVDVDRSRAVKRDSSDSDKSSIKRELIAEIESLIADSTRKAPVELYSEIEKRFINTGITVESAGAINDIYRRLISSLKRKLQETSINYFDLLQLNDENLISTSMKQYVESLKNIEKTRKEREKEIKSSDLYDQIAIGR